MLEQTHWPAMLCPLSFPASSAWSAPSLEVQLHGPRFPWALLTMSPSLVRPFLGNLPKIAILSFLCQCFLSPHPLWCTHCVKIHQLYTFYCAFFCAHIRFYLKITRKEQINRVIHFLHKISKIFS
jgi:hypothetical protein